MCIFGCVYAGWVSEGFWYVGPGSARQTCRRFKAIWGEEFTVYGHQIKPLTECLVLHLFLSMYLLYVEYLICVCVRSEVPCCVLWYLGSGSWVRPSGSLRSRRSEACNYWSPHGPLWGRYGSSDACCSCTDVQDFLIFFFLKKHVCSSTACVFQHICGYEFECSCASNRLQDYI